MKLARGCFFGAALLALAAGLVQAADVAIPADIDGRWRVKDPDTQRDTAIIEIHTRDGAGQGRLDPFDTPPDARCKNCKGELAGTFMHGLPLLQELHVEDGRWKGRILNPNTGRTYALELVSKDGQLHITARALFGLFRHRETWTLDTSLRQ